MNEADSEKLAAGLAKLGWEPAAKADAVDLAVVNTCVIRQKAEDRAVGYMGRLRKLKESREDMQIAVMGCMVGPRTEDLRKRFPFVEPAAPDHPRSLPLAVDLRPKQGRLLACRKTVCSSAPSDASPQRKGLIG